MTNKELKQIVNMLETLQRRYYGYDPVISTFSRKKLISNIDYICRAFLKVVSKNYDFDYILSKLSAASHGMNAKERKRIFLKENLAIGDTISYCHNIGNARFYFCSSQNTPQLLISHEYGQSVTNSVEEVLQSIQETYVNDLGFHISGDKISIFVRDIYSYYYKVKVNVDFKNPQWDDMSLDEKANFDEQWEYLDSMNGNADEEATFFEKDKPYTAYKEKIRPLFKRVKEELFIIDPYINDDLFSMLEIVKKPVNIRVLSMKYQFDSKTLARRFQRERGSCEFRQNNKLHDRYVFFDSNCYLFGSSLNNFGFLPTTIVRICDDGLGKTVKEYFELMWKESQDISLKAKA